MNSEADLEGVAEVKISRYFSLEQFLGQILYNIVAPWSWWLGLSLQESESEEDQWLWGSDNSTLDTNTTYWADGEVIMDIGCFEEPTEDVCYLFQGSGDNGKTCAILGKVSIEWQW